MKKGNEFNGSNEEIISYQKLRTFIGIIGICLPFALVLGCYIFGAGKFSWQHSISHYYYSKMHILFACALCVLGGFLITYKGKPDHPWESRISNMAGYFAFAVAAFPTQFEGFRPESNGTNQYISLTPKISGLWGGLHFGFAAALFVCFIIFCLYFFQIPDDPHYNEKERKKFRRRKSLYRICGCGIAASIVLIAIFHFGFPGRQGILAYTTFVFETTSLVFFGTAWLVKGSIVWKSVPILSKAIEPLR